MKYEFMQLSKKVIKSADAEKYFAKADSAASFSRMFFDEEATYTVSCRNVQISTSKQNSTYTDGILFTFCDEQGGNCKYVDVLISDMLGTFISDWC